MSIKHSLVKKETNLDTLYEYSCQIIHQSLVEKVLFFSKLFLGIPYGGVEYPQIFGTFEERLEQIFTKDEFLLDLSKLDCVTFVEIVLALALVKDFHNFLVFQRNFLQNLIKIRYKNGKPTFMARNHFMSKDWLPNNKDLFIDITSNLDFELQKSTALISTKGWLKKHAVLQDVVPNDNFLDLYLERIQEPILGQNIEIAYILLDDLLKNYKKLITNLPSLTIANIVRPNWDIKDRIGTNIHISHLGFLHNQSTEMIFYHAKKQDKITAVDFKAYLDFCLEIPTIKGILFLKLQGT